MKKIIYITLIFLCNIACANEKTPCYAVVQDSGDHLKPVSGIYDIYNFQFKYYSQVRKVLFKGLSDNPEIRFQVMPSFTPENVLDIEFDRYNNKYYIIYQICEEMIWLSNENWEKVKVRKFKTEIDKESVELIKSLFSTAIGQVRYPPAVEEGEEYVMGLDGEDYYFTVNEYGYGIKVGTVWSPNKGTKMKKLVDVGYQLIELAKSNKKKVKIDAKLKKEIEDLINELKK